IETKEVLRVEDAADDNQDDTKYRLDRAAFPPRAKSVRPGVAAESSIGFTNHRCTSHVTIRTQSTPRRLRKSSTRSTRHAQAREDYREDQRGQDVSGFRRKPEPVYRQGRDRLGIVWLGRVRPIRPRASGRRRAPALQ